MLTVVADEAAREDLAASLDEMAREGARRMLTAALEEEVAAYVAAHAGERDEDGLRLVVCNGHDRPRAGDHGGGLPANAGATSTARIWSPWSGPVPSSRREYLSSGQTRPR